MGGGFEGLEEDFKANMEVDWKPVEFFKNRGDVM